MKVYLNMCYDSVSFSEVTAKSNKLYGNNNLAPSTFLFYQMVDDSFFH